MAGSWLNIHCISTKSNRNTVAGNAHGRCLEYFRRATNRPYLMGECGRPVQAMAILRQNFTTKILQLLVSKSKRSVPVPTWAVWPFPRTQSVLVTMFLECGARTSKASQQLRTLPEGRQLAAQKSKHQCRLGLLLGVRTGPTGTNLQEPHRVPTDKPLSKKIESLLHAFVGDVFPCLSRILAQSIDPPLVREGR